MFVAHAEDQSGVRIRHAPRPSLLNFDTSEFEGAHNGQQVSLASFLAVLLHHHYIAAHDLVPIQRLGNMRGCCKGGAHGLTNCVC